MNICQMLSEPPHVVTVDERHIDDVSDVPPETPNAQFACLVIVEEVVEVCHVKKQHPIDFVPDETLVRGFHNSHRSFDAAEYLHAPGVSLWQCMTVASHFGSRLVEVVHESAVWIQRHLRVVWM